MTIQSILSYVYNLLTTDDELAEIPIHPQWQPPDTVKPYIVQELEIRSTDAPFQLGSGSLTLHLWSESSSASEVLSMRDRILTLTENLDIVTADVNSCRCRLGSEGFIPDDPGIWHYVIVFNLRLIKSGDTARILDRDSGS